MSAANDKPELAVLGGSFDPPHLGHVLLATYALSSAGAARVIVAPAFEHAFGKRLAPMDHRLRMCELAFAPLCGVVVSPIERELGGTSRTLRLVRELGTRYPNYQLRLLVGADILLEAPRWQNFDEICRLAPLLVAGRGGYVDEASENEQGGVLVLPKVSSSELRARLAQHRDASGWIPKSVLAYIARHRLYRAGVA